MSFPNPATASNEPIIRVGPDEREYLLKRADQHKQLAAIAQEKSCGDIHRTLQRLYRERAEAAMIVHHD